MIICFDCAHQQMPKDASLQPSLIISQNHLPNEPQLLPPLRPSYELNEDLHEHRVVEVQIDHCLQKVCNRHNVILSQYHPQVFQDKFKHLFMGAFQ